MTKTLVQRFLLLYAVFTLLLMVCACSTAWTSEASTIITLLGPAITSALAILAAFGIGISPAFMTQVQSWSTQAQAGLTTIASLINQYNTAEASAQPGILNEIETLITTIGNNLSALLPQLHISDPSTQAKIVAVFDAVLAELTSLMNLLPVIKGQVTDHAKARALFNQLKSAKEFANDFNAKAGAFGPSYLIK